MISVAAGSSTAGKKIGIIRRRTCLFKVVVFVSLTGTQQTEGDNKDEKVSHITQDTKIRAQKNRPEAVKGLGLFCYLFFKTGVPAHLFHHIALGLQLSAQTALFLQRSFAQLFHFLL